MDVSCTKCSLAQLFKDTFFCFLGVLSSVNVEISPDVVNKNSEVTFTCESTDEPDLCSWIKPNGDIYVMNKDDEIDKENPNSCSFRLGPDSTDKLIDDYNGQWSCQLFADIREFRNLTIAGT